MWPFKRKLTCWFCHGWGFWSNTTSVHWSGWVDEGMIKCSECDGTGLSRWELDRRTEKPGVLK